MPTTLIHVFRPHDFWIAARDEFPWLEDPTTIPGSEHRAIHAVRSWPAIARAAPTVGAALAQGQYELDTSDYATIEVDDTRLDTPAVEVLEAWSTATSRQPLCDPWWGRLASGRHRLGYSWAAAPTSLLPLASSTLRARPDVETMPEIAPKLAREARAGLERVPANIAARNPHFMDALRLVATLRPPKG